MQKDGKKVRSALLPLPRVHIPTSAYLHATTLFVPLARQDTRQVIFIHKVPLFSLSTSLLCRGANVLLLVRCKDKLATPSTFASAAFPFPIRATGDGLGDTVAVSAGVPLHILLEMHRELPIGVSSAGHTRKGIFSTARTELLGHVLGGEEASVATFDERLEMADSLECCGRKQIQVHL